MMKKHPPHSLGVFPQGPARLGHGHTIAGEQNHHSFHHQREPRPRPGPGHFNRLDPGLITALNPRHPGVQIAFILKEVQMAPRPISSVVNGCRVSARGMSKPGTRREIQMDVQAPLFLIKLHFAHLPRRPVQPQGQPKYRCFIHWLFFRTTQPEGKVYVEPGLGLHPLAAQVTKVVPDVAPARMGLAEVLTRRSRG
jgi:hypothetical protein